MNVVNNTLFIPLFGKSLVSKKGIILKDEKAEYIWEKEQFPLKRKSKSKWLAYYTAMRARVFDDWLKERLELAPDAIVLHIGCGMDSRIERVGNQGRAWFDIDFPEVIEKRREYYRESETYRKLEGDLREETWLEAIPKGANVIVVLEGVSPYLQTPELKSAIKAFEKRFSSVKILMDCYTELGAKLSKYRNPVSEVGVSKVYGVSDPAALIEGTSCQFIKEHAMTPSALIDELQGLERWIFKTLYGGRIARKLYRTYEYERV